MIKKKSNFTCGMGCYSTDFACEYAGCINARARVCGLSVVLPPPPYTLQYEQCAYAAVPIPYEFERSCIKLKYAP